MRTAELVTLGLLVAIAVLVGLVLWRLVGWFRRARRERRRGSGHDRSEAERSLGGG